MKVFPKRLNWRRKTQHKCEQHLIMGWTLRRDKDWIKHRCSLPPVCRCNATSPSHCCCSHLFLPVMGQKKPFPFYIVAVRYVVTATVKITSTSRWWLTHNGKLGGWTLQRMESRCHSRHWVLFLKCPLHLPSLLTLSFLLLLFSFLSFSFPNSKSIHRHKMCSTTPRSTLRTKPPRELVWKLTGHYHRPIRS